MTHASKDGESKLLSQCTLPLTGAHCIKRVLTDLAYLEIDNGAYPKGACPQGSVLKRLSARQPVN